MTPSVPNRRRSVLWDPVLLLPFWQTFAFRIEIFDTWNAMFRGMHRPTGW
jgi:hypothetical protein